MSREAMSEEERRRRRNEASRRCYLRRKAELAAQAQPVGAKNKKPKAKAVEAKPARAKPARREPDPVVAAERLCKTYARVAGGIKPMLKDAAEFLGIVYKSEDQRVAEKVERILAKGLGVSVSRLASDPMEKTRVCLDVVSKAVKTPKFRLDAQEDRAQFVPFPAPGEQPPQSEPEPLPEAPAEPEDKDKDEDEPAEVPVDPALLEKVDAGEADKSEIEIPQGKDGKSDCEDDEDDEDEPDPEDDELEDEDEDDEDDESEEAQERRARRREREESDSIREYETGRWEMMGEMGAQGAFDD